MPIEIRDRDDDRVRDYVALTDVALRSRHEPEHGLFIAEGVEVLRRAVSAGCRPRSFLLDRVRIESVEDILAAYPLAPVYVAGQDLLREVTGFRVHRGVLASMHRPRQPSLADLLAGLRPGRARIVVLEDLVDHTNVGAAFRSVAALSADAIIVTDRCADPLYRRSVRVSMGTVFAVPWARSHDWETDVAALRRAGFVVVALALGADAEPLDRFADGAPERVALVLGAEGDGLAAETISSCDVVVRIPMAGGVDSLNVAAACAVACWALR